MCPLVSSSQSVRIQQGPNYVTHLDHSGYDKYILIVIHFEQFRKRLPCEHKLTFIF
jgi:hypothetical protein